MVSLSKRAAKLLKPLALMKLRKISDLNELLERHNKDDLLAQHKFDGWKIQAIRQNNKTKLFTRRGNEITRNVPELVDELNNSLSNGDFILGELVYFINNKQSISDIQTIAGGSPEVARKRLDSGKGKLSFKAYDMLFNNGKDISKQPYISRYYILKKHVKVSKLIQIPKNYSWDEFSSGAEEALSSGSEGLVIKPKNSVYKYNNLNSLEPSGEQYKWKTGEKAQTDEVILKEYSKGKEKIIFPALQYDGKNLIEVGKLSGLSKQLEKEIKDKIDAGKVVVVEVKFQEKLKSNKFRSMSFSRLRPDKPVKDVVVN